MITLTIGERAALEWQMGETETNAWLTRVETFTNAEQLVRNKAAACKARMDASPDKRSREERDAAEMVAVQPTKLDMELAQAKAHADRKAILAAAIELNLTEAQKYLDDSQRDVGA